MALLSLLDISLSFGGPHILEKVYLQIDSGEHATSSRGDGKLDWLALAPGSRLCQHQPKSLLNQRSQRLPAPLGFAPGVVEEGFFQPYSGPHMSRHIIIIIGMSSGPFVIRCSTPIDKRKFLQYSRKVWRVVSSAPVLPLLIREPGRGPAPRSCRFFSHQDMGLSKASTLAALQFFAVGL